MKKVIIACSMIEDELNKVYKQINCKIPILWMDRGYHDKPKILQEKLQQVVDKLQDMDDILIAFGLCGNGTNGIISRKSRLIIPKFDDCINMLLCNGERRCRSNTKTDNIYLTRGWTLDNESILTQYRINIEKYGEETTMAILEMMYQHYKKICVINTACFPVEEVMDYAKKAADLLGLTTEQTKGSTQIFEKLLTGQWDDNFIVNNPGQPLNTMQWEF